MPPLKSIELDEYQAVNLLSALRASGLQEFYQAAEKVGMPNPLAVLNSGDWIGELVWKLEQRLDISPGDPTFHSKYYGQLTPNRTPKQYVAESIARLDTDLKEIERRKQDAH
jgi:hypothetical protein